MAEQKTMSTLQLLVQIGDGADPEVFAHDCLINTSRGIVFNAETTQETVIDCDALEEPGWQEVAKDGLNAVISGAGRLHTPSTKTWFDWMKSDTAKNVRVKLNNVSLADGGGHFAGAFKLTGYEITGGDNRKEKATVSVTLTSHGEITWVDAAA